MKNLTIKRSEWLRGTPEQRELLQPKAKEEFDRDPSHGMPSDNSCLWNDLDSEGS
jgi:hypothetical protein